MSKKIIVGITGSIAAFKSIQLISNLVKLGYQVEVLMTPSANRFVTKESIQALTKRKVYIDIFDDDPSSIIHIDIVKNADLFIVVPASATTIAKLACGIADNMLTAAYLAAVCPKLIAPAMNVHMYQNTVTQRNINQLKEDGALVIEPDKGLLACGDIGQGKLADLKNIQFMIQYALNYHILKGKKILITAGPTKESLDPIRYISNHSTGKMGYALAKAAFMLGADVHLISGPVNLTIPYIPITHITSAQELFEKVTEISNDYDYIIMSAAVGDYTPIDTYTENIKKESDTMTLSLKKTNDILAYLGTHKKAHQIICGFAMETNHLIENAQKKLNDKKADMIVCNNLKVEGAGFGTDTNVISIITQDKIISYDKKSKEDLSYDILLQCKEMEDKQCC